MDRDQREAEYKKAIETARNEKNSIESQENERKKREEKLQALFKGMKEERDSLQATIKELNEKLKSNNNHLVRSELIEQTLI